jgi:hypothetical protein
MTVTTDTQIAPGMKVLVRDVLDRWLPRIARTGVEPGHTFQIVWVCMEEEWAESTDDERPIGAAWPAEDVRPA